MESDLPDARLTDRRQGPIAVRLVIGADSFEVSGEAPLLAVKQLIEVWIAALPVAAQRSIDALTARAAAANATLEGAVDAATPEPPVA